MTVIDNFKPSSDYFRDCTLNAESKLIQRLYDDVGGSDFFNSFMAELAEVANLRSGMISISNLNTNSIAGGWIWNVDEEAMGRYMQSGWQSQDLLLNYILHVDADRLYSVSMHTPAARNDPAQNHVYEAWAKPLDIYDAGMAILARQESWVCSFIIHRSHSQGDFSECELDALNRLLPHLKRAVALHSGLKRPGQQNSTISPWLSLIKTPVLLLNESLTCIDQNESADSFFEQQQRVRLEERWLTLDDPAATREIAYEVMTSLKRALHGDEQSVGQYLYKGNPETHFYFLPVREQLNEGFSVASVLVFIHQRDFLAPLNFSCFQSEFGFTNAEVQVCELLVRGLSLRDIARTQNKSEETVRSQIKQAFSKSGATNQAELVVRLLTHPATLES